MIIQFRQNKKNCTNSSDWHDSVKVIDTTKITTTIALITCSLTIGFALAVILFLLII